MDVWGYCGSTACALGTLVALGTFEAEGLHRGIRGIPTFEGYTGYRAAAVLFDISLQAAVILFSPEFYLEVGGRQAEEDVIRRLKGLDSLAGYLEFTWR